MPILNFFSFIIKPMILTTNVTVNISLIEVVIILRDNNYFKTTTNLGLFDLFFYICSLIEYKINLPCKH